VIYSGGILLFLGYFLSLFFLDHTNNATVINLADPFGLNGVRLASNTANSIQKNTNLFPVEGTFLLNRIIWSGVGLVILIYTYIRFNFEKFFSGKRDKAAIDDVVSKVKRSLVRNIKVSFKGSYNRSTLFNLTKIELSNIIRDNYFWIILSSGMFFLGFIIFYTGETLHRDRITRYAFINDSLPPPNWVLNGSKLISLLILGAGLAFIPVVLIMAVQIAKGFYLFNFPVYFTYLFIIILPRLLEMVLFSYMVHVIINNKFVAHGIGVFFWVAVFFLRTSGIFNYNLLLYSYTPSYGISDMDGLGHMTAPVNWFNLYWLLFGGLLIIFVLLPWHNFIF